MDWTPPPEPLSWILPATIRIGQNSYTSVTLRAPTAGDVLKANAIPGASGYDVGLRLISIINLEGVPYEAITQLPAYLVDQMASYVDMFGGAPLPDPLEEWRREQAARATTASAEPPPTT